MNLYKNPPFNTAGIFLGLFQIFRQNSRRNIWRVQGKFLAKSKEDFKNSSRDFNRNLIGDFFVNPFWIAFLFFREITSKITQGIPSKICNGVIETSPSLPPHRFFQKFRPELLLARIPLEIFSIIRQKNLNFKIIPKNIHGFFYIIMIFMFFYIILILSEILAEIHLKIFLGQSSEVL